MGGLQPSGVDGEFLAQTALFGGLPERVLGCIAEVARVVHVVAGIQLFQEGEPALGMFVVRDGELEIFKRDRNGDEFRLAVLQRGDCLGEMSLIDIQPRSATVRALSDAVLYTVDRAEIARLYQRDIEVYTLLVLNIAREISRRLRKADQRLIELGIAVASL